VEADVIDGDLIDGAVDHTVDADRAASTPTDASESVPARAKRRRGKRRTTGRVKARGTSTGCPTCGSGTGSSGRAVQSGRVASALTDGMP
jgi:hypothetical protein